MRNGLKLTNVCVGRPVAGQQPCRPARGEGGWGGELHGRARGGCSDARARWRRTIDSARYSKLLILCISIHPSLAGHRCASHYFCLKVRCSHIAPRPPLLPSPPSLLPSIRPQRKLLHKAGLRQSVYCSSWPLTISLPSPPGRLGLPFKFDRAGRSPTPQHPTWHTPMPSPVHTAPPPPLPIPSVVCVCECELRRALRHFEAPRSVKPHGCGLASFRSLSRENVLLICFRIQHTSFSVSLY